MNQDLKNHSNEVKELKKKITTSRKKQTYEK